MGDLLEEDEDYKEYIVSVIEKRLNRKIASTRLVYRYDTLNKTNFHKYIDNQEQLVIVIKLLNGFMPAAGPRTVFENVIRKKRSTSPLTNRKVFDLRAPTLGRFHTTTSIWSSVLRVKNKAPGQQSVLQFGQQLRLL